MTRSLFCLLVLILSALESRGQALHLNLPDGQPYAVGETVEFQLRLTESASRPSLGGLPQVDGLALRGSSATAVEGGWEWTLSLTPWRPGEFNLPALTVDDGQRLWTTDRRAFTTALAAQNSEYLDIILSTTRDRMFVGQISELTVELQFDASFFKQRALQTFGRRLDLPVVLKAPFLMDDPVFKNAGEKPEEQSSCVLNGELVRGRWFDAKTPGEKSRLVLTRTFKAEQVGQLRFGPVIGSFDFASEFDTDFFGALTAQDRSRGRVYSNAINIDVAEPPLPDRPDDFQGILGRVELDLRLAETNLNLAEPILLDLMIRGEGNIQAIPLPRFKLRGIHVFAQRELETSDEKLRHLQLELAVVDPGLKEFPSLTLAYFLPDEETYGRARSRVIPITLAMTEAQRQDWERGKKSPEEAQESQLDHDGIYATPTPGLNEQENRPWTTLDLSVLVAIPGLLTLLLRWWLKRVRWTAANPQLAAARVAYRRFKKAMRSPVPRLRVMTEYLAARSKNSGVAVYRDHLALALTNLNLSEDLLERTESILRILLAADFGESSEFPDDAEILAVVGEIEEQQKRGAELS